jgi:ketosteroid isomerase-like protein
VSGELAGVEEEWRQIVERRDVSAAERLLADDFMLSSAGGFGDQVSRAEWLQSLPDVQTRSLTCEVLDERVFGDLGVVRVRLDWEAAFGGRDLTGSYLVVDVFRREDGAWHAAWRISTRLPPSDG